MFAEDGAADVQGNTIDLWQARQILLRYHEHCHVLKPPELVDMIRETLGRMGQIYNEPTNDKATPESTP